MKSLAGKSALITGAAAGIGRALAERLARSGVHLHLLDVNEKELMTLADTLRAAGHSVTTYACDLLDAAQIVDAVRAVQAQGGVDILINNAGVGYWGPTHEMPAAQWDRVLAINLHAPLQIIRELLPSLLAREEAHIINMSSMLGLVAGPKAAAYSMSKFALQGLTESLRAEYGSSRVGVTAVCPGFATTGLFEAARRAGSKPFPRHIHSWLMTTPEHIADRTISALLRNQPLVVITPLAHCLWLAKRLAPNWFLRLFRTRHRPMQGTTRPAASAPVRSGGLLGRFSHALNWLGIRGAG